MKPGQAVAGKIQRRRRGRAVLFWWGVEGGGRGKGVGKEEGRKGGISSHTSLVEWKVLKPLWQTAQTSSSKNSTEKHSGHKPHRCPGVGPWVPVSGPVFPACCDGCMWGTWDRR